MGKSCNKSLHNREIAHASLVDELLIFRRFGLKTEAALDRLAAFCGISKRRAYAIVFNETTAALTDNDRQHIQAGAVAAKRWLADYLHAWARELHRMADLQEMQERATRCGSGLTPMPSAASAIVSSGCVIAPSLSAPP